jgi:hypothetical protein
VVDGDGAVVAEIALTTAAVALKMAALADLKPAAVVLIVATMAMAFWLWWRQQR